MRADRFFLTLIFAACSCSHSQVNDASYTVANRQHAPEPIYSRVTMARPPETHPASVRVKKGDAKFFAVIHFQIKNQPLEEAAKLLSSTAKYSSYCAAALAGQKITIDTIGTIDEIGERIASQMGIDVTVDHINKEVRFLRKV